MLHGRSFERELDQVVTVKVPAIIDEGTWDRVQQLMDRRAINGPRTKREYVLQGILFCAACNGRLTPVSSKGTTRYKCVRRAHFSRSRPVMQAHGGKRWWWSCKVLEDVAKAFINDWMRRPTMLAPHVERRLAFAQRRVEATLGDVQALEKRVADAEAQESRVLELARRAIWLKEGFEP